MLESTRSERHLRGFWKRVHKHLYYQLEHKKRAKSAHKVAESGAERLSPLSIIQEIVRFDQGMIFSCVKQLQCQSNKSFRLTRIIQSPSNKNESTLEADQGFSKLQAKKEHCINEISLQLSNWYSSSNANHSQLHTRKCVWVNFWLPLNSSTTHHSLCSLWMKL